MACFRHSLSSWSSLRSWSCCKNRHVSHRSYRSAQIRWFPPVAYRAEGFRTYLQQVEVVHTVVNWDHHQLGEDILDSFFEAFCNGLETQKTRFRLREGTRSVG